MMDSWGGGGESGDYYILCLPLSIGQAKWLLSALAAGLVRCCYYCHGR